MDLYYVLIATVVPKRPGSISSRNQADRIDAKKTARRKIFGLLSGGCNEGTEMNADHKNIRVLRDAAGYLWKAKAKWVHQGLTQIWRCVI